MDICHLTNDFRLKMKTKWKDWKSWPNRYEMMSWLDVPLLHKLEIYRLDGKETNERSPQPIQIMIKSKNHQVLLNLGRFQWQTWYWIKRQIKYSFKWIKKQIHIWTKAQWLWAELKVPISRQPPASKSQWTNFRIKTCRSDQACHLKTRRIILRRGNAQIIQEVKTGKTVDCDQAVEEWQARIRKTRNTWKEVIWKRYSKIITSISKAINR